MAAHRFIAEWTYVSPTSTGVWAVRSTLHQLYFLELLWKQYSSNVRRIGWGHLLCRD